MKHRILLLVDCQYDFIDGSLAVNNAVQTMENLEKFIIHSCTGVKPAYEKIFFTVDWHPPAHCSFKGRGGIWPIHCVQYTHGASIQNEILHAVWDTNLPDQVSEKGAVKEREEYSAFGEGTGPAEFKLTAPNHGTFKPEGTHVDIAGIAYDYCVANCALDLRSEGYEVTVFGNLCPSVAGESKVKATDAMLDNGIVLEDWYPPA